jgi:hypothetical protein
MEQKFAHSVLERNIFRPYTSAKVESEYKNEFNFTGADELNERVQENDTSKYIDKILKLNSEKKNIIPESSIRFDRNSNTDLRMHFNRKSIISEAETGDNPNWDYRDFIHSGIPTISIPFNPVKNTKKHGMTKVSYDELQQINFKPTKLDFHSTPFEKYSIINNFSRKINREVFIEKPKQTKQNSKIY